MRSLVPVELYNNPTQNNEIQHWDKSLWVLGLVVLGWFLFFKTLYFGSKKTHHKTKKNNVYIALKKT